MPGGGGMPGMGGKMPDMGGKGGEWFVRYIYSSNNHHVVMMLCVLME